VYILLQIGKMRFNLRNRLKIKHKPEAIKLLSDNDMDKKNFSKNTNGVALPSLSDIEFKWIEDY
jgi:hypothetical protein